MAKDEGSRVLRNPTALFETAVFVSEVVTYENPTDLIRSFAFHTDLSVKSVYRAAAN